MESIKKVNEKKELNGLWLLTVLILFAMLLLTSSCTDTCEVTRSYVNYEPIYTTTQEIRDGVEYLPPKEISNPGRLYFKDGYMYINEVGEGIHVIDNRVPTSPQKLGFVSVPGNFDLAAKGNFLYADSYVDLVVFDISNPNDITEVNRELSVFAGYDVYAGLWDEQRGILTDWEATTVEEAFEADCESGLIVEDFLAADFAVAERAQFNADGGSPAQSGIGGSLAKFTIYDDFLYTINSWEMRLFDISTLEDPEVGSIVQLGWGIETIFPYGDKLFIGARNGMHIYDNANPSEPELISSYQHVNSCDPVVVQDDYAYVTLRSGTECEGFTNQLDIVDISNLSNPRLHKTYQMQNPHGLGIDGSCLFITEGEFGLKFFDVEDVDNLELVSHKEDLHAIDVIPLNENLMVIGNDGFKQYSYNCETGAFNLLSTIAITNL
ncbi:MAG: hypothetical protein RJQ09_12480 [Cyclobacteriaceae bacterium]